MTTQTIVSHVGFGRELTPKLISAQPNYIHRLSSHNLDGYASDSVMKQQYVRSQCALIAMQYRMKPDLEEQKQVTKSARG